MKFLISQRGVSIYLALIIMVVLLGIGLGLSSILIGQIKMMRGMGYSVVAFYAADTGIEKELFYKNYRTQPLPYSDSDFLDLNNPPSGGVTNCPEDLQDLGDACYKITILEGDQDNCPSGVNWCVRSLGFYKGTRRAVEITF